MIKPQESFYSKPNSYYPNGEMEYGSDGIPILLYLANTKHDAILLQTDDNSSIEWCDEDFAPDDSGRWHMSNGKWVMSSDYEILRPGYGHKIVSTYEQRVAREAIEHASALLDAYNKHIKEQA